MTRSAEKKKYWAEGERLIIMNDASLPADVCLLTGEPAVKRERFSVGYLSPALRVLDRFIPGIHLLASRPVGFSYGMSEQALRRDHKADGVRYTGLAIGLSLILVGGLAGPEEVAIAGIVMLIAGPIVARVMRPGVKVKWVEEDRITLIVEREVMIALGLVEHDPDHDEVPEVEARQASETRIRELEGARLRSVIGVAPQTEDGLIYAYLQVGSGWFRFYVDEAVLFFEPVSKPATRDCDAEQDCWVEVFEPDADADATIARLEYADSVLEFELADGTTLRFVDNPQLELLEVHTL